MHHVITALLCRTELHCSSIEVDYWVGDLQPIEPQYDIMIQFQYNEIQLYCTTMNVYSGVFDY